MFYLRHILPLVLLRIARVAKAILGRARNIYWLGLAATFGTASIAYADFVKFTQLPTSPTVREQHIIVDASSCPQGSIIMSGGGHISCPVFWNGINWIANPTGYFQTTPAENVLMPGPTGPIGPTGPRGPGGAAKAGKEKPTISVSIGAINP